MLLFYISLVKYNFKLNNYFEYRSISQKFCMQAKQDILFNKINI